MNMCFTRRNAPRPKPMRRSPKNTSSDANDFFISSKLPPPALNTSEAPFASPRTRYQLNAPASARTAFATSLSAIFRSISRSVNRRNRRFAVRSYIRLASSSCAFTSAFIVVTRASKSLGVSPAPPSAPSSTTTRASASTIRSVVHSSRVSNVIDIENGDNRSCERETKSVRRSVRRASVGASFRPRETSSDRITDARARAIASSTRLDRGLHRVRASPRDDRRAVGIKVHQHALPSRERPSPEAAPQDAERDAVVARALARVVRAADPASREPQVERHGATRRLLTSLVEACARGSSGARSTSASPRATRV